MSPRKMINEGGDLKMNFNLYLIKSMFFYDLEQVSKLRPKFRFLSLIHTEDNVKFMQQNC